MGLVGERDPQRSAFRIYLAGAAKRPLRKSSIV